MSEKAVRDSEVRQILRFEKSDAELVEIGQKGHDLKKEIEDLDIQFTKKKKEWKEMIESKQAQLNSIWDIFDKRAEEKEVDCTKRMDWNDKKVYFIHEGKTIEERDMTDSEVQMVMDTEEKPKKKKKKKKAVKNMTPVEKNPDKNLTPEELKQRETQDVHKEETNRRSKVSAVD